MSTLREEYNKSKQLKMVATKEAAIGWVMENVIVLDESFNRESLQRLQGSITKFDSMFAAYGDKVPEVKRSLDDAVEILNRITMGEKIVRKDGKLRLSPEETSSLEDPATYMVKYMSLLYNNLSRFFSKDMRILLELPLFKMARDNPGTPLKDLVETPRMRKAILHALEPSPDTQTMLRRMYRSMELPSLDYETIADQLLSLTAEDFVVLTHVGKVPLVVSPLPSSSVSPKSSSPGPTSPGPTSPGPEQSSKVEQVKKDHEGPEGEEILTEIGEVDATQLKQTAELIKTLKGLVVNFPTLGTLNQSLEKLQSQALAATGGKTSSAPIGGLGAVSGTATMVINYFSKLSDLGPSIKELIPTDRPLGQGELSSIEGILKKAQGGLMQRFGNWLRGVQVDPNLTPTSISAQIGQFLKQDPTNIGKFFDQLATLNLQEQQPPAAPAQQQQQQGTAASAPGTPSNTQTPQGATATPGNAPAAPEAATAPAGTAPATGSPKVTPRAVQLAQQMASVPGAKITLTDEFKAQVQALLDAGFQISRVE